MSKAKLIFSSLLLLVAGYNPADRPPPEVSLTPNRGRWNEDAATKITADYSGAVTKPATVDDIHLRIDGAEAARFMSDLVRLVSEPMVLMARL